MEIKESIEIIDIMILLNQLISFNFKVQYSNLLGNFIG